MATASIRTVPLPSGEQIPRARTGEIATLAGGDKVETDQVLFVANDIVVEIAEKHGVATAQVALAWVLRQDDVCAIPKASIPEHVRENRGALDLQLDSDDLKAVDEAFPAPTGPVPLPLY